MTDDNPDPREQQPAPPGIVEQRSASGTAIQAVFATSALVYGLGHLAEGTAKLKDSLGGGQGKQPPPTDQPPGKAPE